MMRHWLMLNGSAVAVAILAPAIADAQAGSPAAMSGPSVAAAGPDNAIGDIVVTAQRRSSVSQNTPLAITAIGGATLAQRQITNIQDLVPSLPSVSINPTLGVGRIAIRGVGLDTTQTGGEGRVAFHLDGVYVSRPSATLGTFFDVDRIEVVRGPQGTLYGRNATAGAINLITPDPGKDFGGYARLTLGNYGLVQSDAAVDIPLGPQTGLRIAGQTIDRDGYGKNVLTGKDVNDAMNRSVRATVLQKIGDKVSFRLSADYHHENDSDYAFYYLGAGNPLITPLGVREGGQVASGYDTADDFQQRNRRTFYGGSLITTVHLGGPTLTSVTGYRHSNTAFSGDADGTSFDAGVSNQFERAHQVSEEVRLAGDYGRGDYILGVYYFQEHIDGYNAFAPLNQLILATGKDTLVQGFAAGGVQDTHAYAGFGEINFNITDKLRLVAGGRYSYERKAVDEFTVTDTRTPYSPTNPIVPQRTLSQGDHWGSFTPRAGLEYRPRPSMLLFATYSEGFKSGGYALGALQPAVKPEKLRDYEIGLKADFFDHHLRTNLSAFYYDYSNLQISKVVSGGTQLVNAAKARLKGVEAEITATPVRGIQFDLIAAYLDAHYTDFQTADPARPTLGVLNLDGNDLSQAAPYTIDFGAQYSFDASAGKVTLRGEVNASGKTYFSPFNRDILSQRAFVKANAFLNFEKSGGRWTVSLFARNLTNKRTLTFAYTSNPLFGTPVIGAYAPPRTFGAMIGYKF